MSTYGHSHYNYNAVGQSSRCGAGVGARVAQLNIFDGQSVTRRLLLGHCGPARDVLSEPASPCPFGGALPSRIHAVEMEDAGG